MSTGICELFLVEMIQLVRKPYTLAINFKQDSKEIKH